MIQRERPLRREEDAGESPRLKLGPNEVLAIPVDDDEELPGAAVGETQPSAPGIEAQPKPERQWNRQPVQTGQGAMRVRTFHGRLTDQGMEYMDEMINDWLDQHPEIEVKFVTSSVGEFEGTTARVPSVVLNVWY